MDIKCIVAIVERGKADKIVDMAKKGRSKRSYYSLWERDRTSGSIRVF